MASTRAPQVTFDADGRARYEQTAQGRNVTVTTSLNRDLLTVTTRGDRGSDYSVTFEPLDNCRALRVTRSIYNERLSQPVRAVSVYEKTSDIAQFDLYNGASEFPSEREARRGSFFIPDGTLMTAVLNTDLTTRQARDGDRFTMTVRSPGRYDGALIEDYLTGSERSGRVSGRAELSLNFERIRLRNGSSYDFAGTIESVRTPGGENVRVDNEGEIRGDDSQTSRTVTRTGIGAALGAVIGAIAGGGKGAAIGAAVGAGAGAGSVFIQGREDLELTQGTEFTIRSSAPR